MRAFFVAVQGLINIDCSVKVQRTYQVVESTNGHILSEATLASDPALVQGSGSGSYAGPAGAVVNWETGLFNAAGHRVRGRTYLVPMNGAAYEADGSLGVTTLTTLTSAGTAALGGTGGMVVWTRPSGPGLSDGTARTVTAAVVHDRVCILRSRRD